MAAIKNEETEAKCVEWAKMLNSTNRIEVSNLIRDWAAGKAMAYWTLQVIANRVAELSREMVVDHG